MRAHRFHIASRAAALVCVVLFVGCGSGAEAAGRGPRAPMTGEAQAERPSIGAEEKGGASYYSDRFTGRKTASGERYQPAELTAAHRSLPFGAVVEVIRVKDGRRVEVRINDRGPHVRGRIIDLSRRAAEAIGVVQIGVAEVRLRVISLPPPKATKKKRR